MRITRTDEHIIVRCEGERFEDELNAVKHLPSGVYSRKEKIWKFPIPAIIDLMRNIPVDMITHISDGVQESWKQERTKLEYLQGALKMDWVNTHDFLMGHQHMAVNIARLYDRFAFFYDTGTGKTITGLHIMGENLDRKWLIIPPKSTIKPAWVQDAVDFYPHIRIWPLSNNFNKADYMEILTRWGVSFNEKWNTSKMFSVGCQSAHAFIVNTESFKKYIPLLHEHNVTGCIFDESVKLKSTKAQITKDFTEYAKDHLDKVYLLSGKPAPNGEEDYFSQLKIVEPAVFGEGVTKFKDYYFEPVGMFDIRLKPERKEEFAERLSTRSIVVRKQDCLDLPPEVFEKRSLELDGKSLELYREMSREFLIEVQGKEFKAVNAGVLRNKLRQITSGFAYVDGQAYRIHNSKLQMLDEIMEALGDEPVIVWIAFQEDVHAVVEHLQGKDIKVVTAYSRTKNLDDSVKAFMDNDAQVIVAHPGSIKYGITFCGRNMKRNCTNAIYYSFTENYDDFYQSKDRIYRKGQTEKVTYYFLMMEKTVDQLTYKSLMNKGANATLMEDLIQLAKAVISR